MPTIETPRLVLRPLVLGDEDDLFAYQSDPEIVRYIPWPVRTREQVRAALEAFAGERRLEETGDGASFAVVEKASRRVIGQMNLSILSRADRQGEFGYVIARPFGRRGYATEASHAVLNHAFDVLGLHRMIAQMDVRNLASAALAEKLGMRREAELRENEWFKGEWTSMWIYGIVRDEWIAVRDDVAAR